MIDQTIEQIFEVIKEDVIRFEYIRGSIGDVATIINKMSVNRLR